LRDAITAHIESEAKRTGTYHGDPAATPGGTGYCIPGAVATQIVDKHLLDYFAEARATPPALDALLALLDFDPCHECDNAQKVYDAIARLSASGESPDD
jgi:hypothetical protein